MHVGGSGGHTESSGAGGLELVRGEMDKMEFKEEGGHGMPANSLI